jgi:hypothetical protein
MRLIGWKLSCGFPFTESSIVVNRQLVFSHSASVPRVSTSHNILADACLQAHNLPSRTAFRRSLGFRLVRLEYILSFRVAQKRGGMG